MIKPTYKVTNERLGIRLNRNWERNNNFVIKSESIDLVVYPTFASDVRETSMSKSHLFFRYFIDRKTSLKYAEAFWN